MDDINATNRAAVAPLWDIDSIQACRRSCWWNLSLRTCQSRLRSPNGRHATRLTWAVKLASRSARERNAPALAYTDSARVARAECQRRSAVPIDLVVAVDGIRGPRGSRGIGAGLAAIDLPTFNRKIRNDQTSRVEGAARIIFVNWGPVVSPWLTDTPSQTLPRGLRCRGPRLRRP